jgi:hypothetical protein
LYEGASSHKGAGSPQAQLTWAVPKGPQRLGLLAQAVQVVVGQQELRMQLSEEALQQPGPELSQGFLQVQVGTAVVQAQLGVQVPEGPGVLSVQLPEGTGEGILQLALRVVQQALKVVCTQAGV